MKSGAILCLLHSAHKQKKIMLWQGQKRNSHKVVADDGINGANADLSRRRPHNGAHRNGIPAVGFGLIQMPIGAAQQIHALFVGRF